MRLSIILDMAAVKEHLGTRERKRIETGSRITEAASRLATERGISATTVDDIATEAGIGRATFFRYFESKELAIATGLSDVGVHVLAEVLAGVPAELGPLDAVRAAYAKLGEDFDALRPMFLEQAQLSRSSKVMFAWTLHLYVDWENAIAKTIAPRFADLALDDPRPRMVGAMTMAAARLACDLWVADDGRGDLPELIQQHLSALHLDEGAP